MLTAVMTRVAAAVASAPEMMTGLQLKVLSHLTKEYKGKDKLKELLVILRQKSKLGFIPCQQDRTRQPKTKHRIQSHGWNPVIGGSGEWGVLIRLTYRQMSGTIM